MNLPTTTFIVSEPTDNGLVSIFANENAHDRGHFRTYQFYCRGDSLTWLIETLDSWRHEESPPASLNNACDKLELYYSGPDYHPSLTLCNRRGNAEIYGSTYLLDFQEKDIPALLDALRKPSSNVSLTRDVASKELVPPTTISKLMELCPRLDRMAGISRRLTQQLMPQPTAHEVAIATELKELIHNSITLKELVGDEDYHGLVDSEWEAMSENIVHMTEQILDFHDMYGFVN